MAGDRLAKIASLAGLAPLVFNCPPRLQIERSRHTENLPARRGKRELQFGRQVIVADRLRDAKDDQTSYHECLVRRGRTLDQRVQRVVQIAGAGLLEIEGARITSHRVPADRIDIEITRIQRQAQGIGGGPFARHDAHVEAVAVGPANAVEVVPEPHEVRIIGMGVTNRGDLSRPVRADLQCVLELLPTDFAPELGR